MMRPREKLARARLGHWVLSAQAGEIAIVSPKM
jgi:hypothetical protein